MNIVEKSGFSAATPFEFHNKANFQLLSFIDWYCDPSVNHPNF